MTGRSHDNDFEGLRKRAERELRREKNPAESISQEEALKTLHELRVHQVELETQNEQLRETQAELEESRNRYTDLFDFAPVGYFVVDSKGCISEVNLTGASMIGKQRNDLIAKPFALFVGTEDKDAFYLNRRHVFQTGACKRCELKMLGKDGYKFFAELLMDPVTSADGEVAGCRIAVIDVTQSEQAQEALVSSEERLKLVIESSRTGTWDWDLKTNRVTGNDILYEMLGLNFDGSHQTAETFFYHIHPEDRPRVERNIESVLKKGNQLRDEFRMVREDGGVRWLMSRGRLYRDENGQPIRMAGVNYDISPLKFAEDKIKGLAKFPAENPYPVMRLSADGTILYSNRPGNMFLEEWGCATGQKAPDNWRRLVRDSLRHTRMIIEKARCGDHTFSFAITPIHEGGYVNLYGRDITVQEKIKEELRNHQKQLETKVKERTAELAQTVDLLQQEIAQRQRAEQSLRERSKHLDAFFSYIITPLIILDKQFNFIRVNQAYAAACGRNIEDFPGHNHFEFYPHEENQRIFEETVRTKTAFQVFAKPFSFPDHPEWGVTYWDWTLVPVLDETGDVEILIFSLKDVTEREQAESEVRAKRQALQKLTTELQIVEEQERRRLAVDLHDSVGQLLALSSWEINSLRKSAPRDLQPSLENAWNHLNEAIQKTRTLSFDLSPTILYDLGFEAAIEDLVDKMSKERHIHCRFDNSSSDKPLSEEVKVLLYRAVRELLINAAKHAEPDLVKVSISRSSCNIYVKIEDNGKGFDMTIVKDELTRKKGFGLFSISERLNHKGGQLKIESAEGRGTTAILIAPLHVDNESERS